MNFQDFTAQIDRLKTTYGENYFGSERSSLIWHTTKSLQLETFKRICNWFLANSKSAPLPADFMEQVNLEKKKTEYKINNPFAHQNQINSVFSEEERKEIFNVMRLCAEGKVTREHALAYAEALENALKAKGVVAPHWRKQDKNGDWIA